MTSVSLVTAVYGAYDEVKKAPPGFDACILVTDQKLRPLRTKVKGWQVVELPMPHLHPRVAAKVPKCRPDWFTDTDASVWIDGSFRVNDARFAHLARTMLADHELVVCEHPESVPGPTWTARNCLYEEATFSASRPKYVDQPVVEQAEDYVSRGMPKGWGLWALGIIGRQHTQVNRELGLEWLLEIERWTVQDQVSLPFLLWQRGLRPAVWPFHQLDNDFLELVKHMKR